MSATRGNIVNIFFGNGGGTFGARGFTTIGGNAGGSRFGGPGQVDDNDTVIGGR